MNTVDIIGWVAGALVLATFCLRTMVPLRGVAIASNIAFVTYGVMASALPIVVLHLALLPLNVLRLSEMCSLIRNVKRASRGALATEILLPYMQRQELPAGTSLFRKGDRAGEVFLILDGSVRIVGKNALLKSGELLGEMGIFSPGQRRTDTAVCESKVRLASIADDKIWALFRENPEFGAHLLRLIMLRCHPGQEGGPAALVTR